MNDTRNRDKPARDLTKREEAAIRVWANHPSVSGAEAARWADELFDQLDPLDHLPELAHAYEEPLFDHEGTP